jgi:hypothetical protein
VGDEEYPHRVALPVVDERGPVVNDARREAARVPVTRVREDG